jgi:hypothetical protein
MAILMEFVGMINEYKMECSIVDFYCKYIIDSFALFIFWRMRIRGPLS